MAEQTRRLWEKGGALDETVHRFTVGDDPHWDQQLVYWDCLGSAAHARTLARIGVLDEASLAHLLTALRQIADHALAGHFEIPPALEDCHTAIETELTRMCGDAGLRIHAGRSRNDQVATAMRLFLRATVIDVFAALQSFADTLAERIRRDGQVAMPGYTHLQPAMPTTVGQWLHAFAEATLEQMHAAANLLDRLDACPLGTGAGFGVPLPLDRRYTADLLGFSRVQRNPTDVQNSRGLPEKNLIRLAADVGGIVEKFCCDMILFNTAEFGFVKLPEALTTGSSIMPNKKNPDVLELLRGRCGRWRARVVELEWITGKLTSGYHRDLQLTKEPAIRTAGELLETLAIVGSVAEQFEINADRLAAALRPELYATHAALKLVQDGVPFREAYRQVAEELRAGRFDESVAGQYRPLTKFDEQLLAAWEQERATLQTRVSEYQKRIAAAEAALLPTSS